MQNLIMNNINLKKRMIQKYGNSNSMRRGLS